MNMEPTETNRAAVAFPANAPLTSLLLERVIEGGAICGGDLGHHRLFEGAEANGFLPLLYRYFGETGRLVPGHFAKDWRVHIARLALYRAELRRVLQLIEPLSPVVVLKGGALAMLLFGDERLRNTTDMDLLVDPAKIDAIVEALAAIGYHTSGDGKAKTWAYNQLLLVHEDFGTLIELHWRIAFPHVQSPAIADLLRDTIPVTLDCGTLPMRSLRPEMLLLQLCFHFHQHHGFFKGLIDIAGWVDRFEETADLDEIRAIARQNGVDGVLQWGVHTLAAFTGVRSRLYDPDANLFAKSWAAWTVEALERRYISMVRPGVIERWWERPRTATKIAGTLVDALSMSVVDAPTARVRAVLSPILLGPHRLGRGVFSLLERLQLTDRDALYERRILG